MASYFLVIKKYTIVKCGRKINQIYKSAISKVKMLRGHKHVENGFPFILFDISMWKSKKKRGIYISK